MLSFERDRTDTPTFENSRFLRVSADILRPVDTNCITPGRVRSRHAEDDKASTETARSIALYNSQTLCRLRKSRIASEIARFGNNFREEQWHGRAPASLRSASSSCSRHSYVKIGRVEVKMKQFFCGYA